MRPKSVPLTIMTRSFKNLSPWDTASIFDHIDDQISSFNNPFLDILNQNTPIKSFKAKHKKSHLITAGIRDLMSKCDASLKYARMTMNSFDWEAYRILGQKVKSKIKATGSRHVKEEIVNNLSNKSSIWKIVRRCLNLHDSSNF